ncbi:MAG: flagellar basal body-associated FliL family protein [Bdellovibrionales bacterium]
MAKDDKEDTEEKEPSSQEASKESEGKEGEGLDPPKKGLPKKMIIIIAAALILLGGGGAGLYFSGVLGGGHAVDETTDAAGHGEEGHEAPKKMEHGDVPAVEQDENVAPTFYSLGDILVNLSGDGKRPNFLKIRVSLELASEKDVAAIEALKPRIIDNFQVYLRELRIEDLRGSAGLYRLREELLLRVTEAVQPIRVRDVLFQEMLVQ